VLPVADLQGVRKAYAINSGNGILTAKGYDTCGNPNTAQLQAFWNATPYWFVGLYLGGSNVGCSSSLQMSPDYVNYAVGLGYKVGFFWVGPQAPCNNLGLPAFSSDPGTAYNQGKQELINAWNTLISSSNPGGAGVLNGANLTVVTYDLEDYCGSATARAAAQSFIEGWDEQAQVSPPQVPGVYGSVCGSYLNDFAGLNSPPENIWGANWDGNPDTTVMVCIPSGNWIFHQRLKQYNGGHTEQWNGVSMSIDSDCSNGPLSPGPDSFATTC